MNDEMLDRLVETGALLEGHFRLSSGLHSDRYVQCAQLLQHPLHARWAGEAIARLVGDGFDRVAAPAMGAIIIGHEVAAALDIPFCFAERIEGTLQFRRGLRCRPGERVLLIEDVVTTAGSLLELAAAVLACGAEIGGKACLVHRGKRLPSDLVALAHVTATTYGAEDCRLCETQVPVEYAGSRTVASV